MISKWFIQQGFSNPEVVVVPDGDPVGRALRPTRHDGTWSVDVVWETTRVSLFLSNPVLVGNALFGLSEKARGQFFALDADTGNVLWLGPPREASNTAVMLEKLVRKASINAACAVRNSRSLA